MRGHRAGVRRPGGAAVRGPRRPLRADARAGRTTLRYVPSGREPVLHRRVAAGRRSTTRRPHYAAARRPPAAAPVPRPEASRPADRVGGPVDLRERGVAADGQGDRLGLVPRAVARPPRPRPAPTGDDLRRPVRRPRPGARRRWPRCSPRPCPTRVDRHRLRRARPPAGRRRTRARPRRAAAAGACADRGGPAPARRPRAHPAPRRVRRDAVGLQRRSARLRAPRARSTGPLAGPRLGWWQGFFNSVASGPPGFRVRQLLALARAGFVRFLGAGDVDRASPTPTRLPRGRARTLPGRSRSRRR